MTKDKMILLPNGEYMERLYENALIMEVGYQSRLEEMLFNDTKEGAVLLYIIRSMNENNELVCNLDVIANAMHCARATVTRAVRVFKEKYSDLVTVGREGVVSKFTIDKNRCFKA